MKTLVKILSCGCHKITSEGNVFSCLDQYSKKGIWGIQTFKTTRWKKLTPTTTQSGYLQIAIHGKSIRVNRLIAQGFIPNLRDLPEVQHINGVKKDNRKDNLKWGTPKENAYDREIHGHTMRGVKNPLAKLNDDKVREIKGLRLQGWTFMAIALKFNVSKKLVMLVVQNKIWRHVR